MIRLKRRRAARGWDLYAAGMSAACVLHCLGLPLLATLLPVTSQTVDNHLLHVVLVMLAVPVTLWVVWGEGADSESGVFAAVALTGLTLMVMAVTVAPLEQFEVALTLTGGAMLGGAHIWRWFHHRASIEGDA